MAYFSGQGIVSIATRSGSPATPGTFRDVGNVPEFKVSLNTSVKEHKESRTGQRVSDGRLITEKKVTVSITLEELSKENLAMALLGTADSLPSADTVHLFSTAQVEYWVKFVGKNTLNADKAVTVELFRVIFDPLKELGVIQDDYAKFQLEGSALYDVANDTAGATLGGFGRVILAP